MFEPVQSDRRWPVPHQSQPMNPVEQQWYTRQASLLGPFASVLQGGDLLRRGDIPALETNLNFQQMLLAEQDRQRAFEEMARARGAIGADPSSQYVRNQLMGQIDAGGPFDDMLRQQIEGALRNQSALALQGADRRMSEDFARRGLGGSATEYQQAALQQQAGADLSSQIADFREQAALANQQATSQFTQMLQQQAMQEEAQRAMFDDMIARLFSETERAPVDLSALVAPRPGANKPV
jgi:hypothetical protein